MQLLAAPLLYCLPTACFHLPVTSPVQSCQADPLGEMQAWQAAILEALPALRPTSPPLLHHVSALIVQVSLGQERAVTLPRVRSQRASFRSPCAGVRAPAAQPASGRPRRAWVSLPVIATWRGGLCSREMVPLGAPALRPLW